MTRLTFSLAVFCLVLACPLFALAPTPVPTPTSTPWPTRTPTPTATPRFILLPSVEILTDQIAEREDLGFTYIKYHFVAEGSQVWILYGWPERDERMYRAVFRLVDGEWKLMETRPMETPTATATPQDGAVEAMK
jgi:hypothetical protein